MAYSLLRKAKELTGWTDAEIAEIVGVSRQLVQKVLADLTPEYLGARQVDALFGAVRLYIDLEQQSVDEARKALAELEAFR